MIKNDKKNRLTLEVTENSEKSEKTVFLKNKKN